MLAISADEISTTEFCTHIGGFRPEIQALSIVFNNCVPTKKIILVELTVPWEERCTQAHERKKAKYEDVVQECREAGWRAWNYPIEVGCRGFPAPSLGKMFQDMGIVGQARKLAIKKVSQAAERGSSWLWLRRNASSWKSSTNG
ncbi:uncharacterized protein LOC127872232 [Dreissena polymorpha]|uniref:uncharacterized protein LOC127872232 n=1 Tax=Dreissena polymorpha TaxID=45954 RepID=UPI0022641B73|nr:uncharacterized protein LOC127872232 [Dreissena polymorpha]